MERLEEVTDLIAEAARTSPHAARAYNLIYEQNRGLMQPLAQRQALIAGRMKDAA